LTAEARVALERADIVLSIVSEPAGRAWLERLNPRTQSLHGLYDDGRKRSETYALMSDEILRHVRQGLDVCLAVYGHPGVFVTPAHDAIARARDEGYPTRLLPGISAEDCLFADLGVDPSRFGWQSHDATEFLVNRRRPEPSTALVLWQIGTVGNELAAMEARPVALAELVELLLTVHARDHPVTVYEAAPYPGFDPLVHRVPLGELSPDDVTAMSTLYVPPARPDQR
jgi:uncharacterized protein YabN with tetrapyrrole methylase and pyrophosphatase domain